MAAPHSDALILGGGVIGLSCALYLLKAGASVRVIEQGKVGQGASHGNCGTLTPSHAGPLTAPGTVGRALRSMLRRDAPFYVSPRPDLARLRWLLGFARRCNGGDFARIAEARAAILQRSLTLIEDLVQTDALDCGFARDGTLYVYRDPRALAADVRHAELLDRLGIAVEHVSAERLQAMEPALRPGLAGGYFHPGDAHLRPDRYVAELARRVRELGGVIEESARVERFVHERGRIGAVRTHRGVYYGDRVVLALGAWSPAVARLLGLRLPMQPGKGYSLTYTRPRQAPRRPLVLHEASVCVTAWADGFRLGSTMEFSGYDSRLNDLRLDAIKRGAGAYLHEPAGPLVREMWWGWRPMCVDELPIVGPSGRWSNLMLATGHGMLGVSMSAATGELVAALCAGPAPSLDPTPYAPSRFGL